MKNILIIKIKSLHFLIPLLLFFSFSLVAQSPEQNESASVLILKINGGASIPANDLADRFGFNGVTGIGLFYKTKSNWTFGSEIDFLFGSKVKEDTILKSISTNEGFLIGLDGHLYSPILYERGYRWHVGISKILPLNEKNKNSGLLLSANVGLLQHKIFYDVKQRDNLPQISKTMQKGYDRMSRGISLTEFIGYHYMSTNRLINFSLGLEFTQGFTKNRRSINFDTHLKDDLARKDFLYGLKFSWFLPFYKSNYEIEYIID